MKCEKMWKKGRYLYTFLFHILSIKFSNQWFCIGCFEHLQSEVSYND